MLTDINLGWGNPYFLLELLEEMYTPLHNLGKISQMSYPPKDGLPELQDLTKKVIKETTGLSYNHVIITNGATSAINTILKYEKPKTVITQEYGYPLYERILNSNNIGRIKNLKIDTSTVYPKYMKLIDSPGNPTGEQFLSGGPLAIWDAVYHSQIYTYDLNTFPKIHKYFVGSYSKLLGLAGCRIGFIATNDPFLRDELYFENWKDLAGVSVLSQNFLIDVLKRLNLQSFLDSGEKRLHYNREEFQKLEYLFGNQLVNEVGMFYCAKCDEKLFKFFDKCNIQYVRLDDETMRLSMGHELGVTKEAIKRILEMDKIK
jgi:aspartate/methionine/tyrosine aminotransferase